MNVIYFVKNWPQRDFNGVNQKILSLAETLINLDRQVHFASIDTQPRKDNLQQYPFFYLDLNPKKINASLQAIKLKPSLIIFNNWEMENLYSAYVYNRWNKCPRLLQVNRLDGLASWRSKTYTRRTPEAFLDNKTPILPEKADLLFQKEAKAIIRSDINLVGNEFISYAVQKYYKQGTYAVTSFGLPLNQYFHQKKNLQYRPFELREHFFFIGDLSKPSTMSVLETLAKQIWPLIRSKLPSAQLHIYGSSFNERINKGQFSSPGIKLKGYMEDIERVSSYKALLYPARYEAGLKSKIIDSWFAHTPIVTTPVGAEGLFLQSTDMKRTFNMQNMSQTSGFVSERYLSQQQNQMQKKIYRYYDSNNFEDGSSKQLTFGGLFRNNNIFSFAESAVSIYNDQNLWNKCLQNAQKTLLRNQNENQLQRNLTQLLNKSQLLMMINRKNRAYADEWQGYLKSPEYHDKVKGKNLQTS